MEEKRNTTEEIAYKAIKEDIISGVYRSGERLIEVDIAQSLSLSRTPVRDALKRLEQEGYLKREPYKGMMVRKYSIKELSDYYQLRAVLDALCAFLVTKNCDNKLKEFLKTNIAASKKAVQENNYKHLAALNSQLHVKLAEASNNNLLYQMLEKLWACSAIMRISNWALPNRPNNVVEEHTKIVDAIIKGKKLLAARMAMKHMINAYKNAKSILERGNIY